MKKVLFILFVLFNILSFAQAPSNDDCSGAISLPAMPAPTSCNGNTAATYYGAWNTVTNSTNVNANIASTTVVGCTPTDSPDDVWYKIVLNGTSMQFNITNAINFTKTRISVYSSPTNGGCGATDFGANGCDSIIGGNGTVTIDALSNGRTYFIQISGNDGSENGPFSLSVRGIRDCGCVTNANIVASPVPTNGYYLPGQVVNFTFKIINYTQLNTNWLHGVIVEALGNGWEAGSLTPATPPASCDGSGRWMWYNSVTSSISSNGTHGPGFFYDRTPYDNNPGNNYGDNCSNHTWTFNWSLKVRACPFTPSPTSLTFKVNTLGDGESGSWTSYDCNLDDEFQFEAYYQPFPPPTMASSPEICTSKGSISATITGGVPNFPMLGVMGLQAIQTVLHLFQLQT